MGVVRRSRPPETEEGSPAWMTTYADMTTLLLCFFVLLFSFSALDAQKFEAILISFQGSAGVLSAGRTVVDRSVLDGSTTKIEDEIVENVRREIQQLQDLAHELQQILDREGISELLQLSLEDRGLVVRFTELLLFDSGSTQLRPEVRPILTVVGNFLAGVEHEIRIEGHTDPIPIRTQRHPTNWDLSSDRAVSVLRFLEVVVGIPGYRMSATGYAEHRPIAPSTDAEARARNRRVDLVLIRPSLSLLDNQ